MPRHRPLLTLKPRIKELDLVAARGIKMVKYTRTLKDKQQANGRTLALDGKAWRDLRAYVLAGEPLCRHCTAEGKTVAATDVDHRDNDPTNNELVNLQPLCHEHHSIKTMAELHGFKAPTGCDEHGMPLDPCHPWNVAAKAEKSPATDAHRPPCTPRAHSRKMGGL